MVHTLEKLAPDELLALRNAMLFRENLRLQMELAERDLKDLQDRLQAKYGPDLTIRTDTGVITRAAPEAA